MKKIASILLLAMLLFNFIGYRFFTAYMEEKANAKLEAQLDDNNYNESELISIKVPAEHFAYYNNSKEFERVDGEIELNGIQYKYVKKRLYNDSLEYMCIPNADAMKLKSAKDEFFKLVNDLQHPGQSKKTDSHSSKNFSIDNYTVSDFFTINRVSVSIPRLMSPSSTDILTRSSATAEQPPEHC